MKKRFLPLSCAMGSHRSRSRWLDDGPRRNKKTYRTHFCAGAPLSSTLIHHAKQGYVVLSWSEKTEIQSLPRKCTLCSYEATPRWIFYHIGKCCEGILHRLSGPHWCIGFLLKHFLSVIKQSLNRSLVGSWFGLIRWRTVAIIVSMVDHLLSSVLPGVVVVDVDTLVALVEVVAQVIVGVGASRCHTTAKNTLITVACVSHELKNFEKKSFESALTCSVQLSLVKVCPLRWISASSLNIWAAKSSSSRNVLLAFGCLLSTTLIKVIRCSEFQFLFTFLRFGKITFDWNEGPIFVLNLQTQTGCDENLANFHFYDFFLSDVKLEILARFYASKEEAWVVEQKFTTGTTTHYARWRATYLTKKALTPFLEYYRSKLVLSIFIGFWKPDFCMVIS